MLYGNKMERAGYLPGLSPANKFRARISNLYEVISFQSRRDFDPLASALAHRPNKLRARISNLYEVISFQSRRDFDPLARALAAGFSFSCGL
jgi:hypothetical protein